MSIKKFWDAVFVGYNYQYMFNTIQMNNGNGTFSDVAQMSGVSKTDWSWAPMFVDFDNDGVKDLFITNGNKKDARNNDYMRQTNGGKKEMAFQDKLDLMPSTKIVNYIFKNEGGLKFEKKMKIKYEKYCTHNPMLKGNGSTECFDLIILPDLENWLKEQVDTQQFDNEANLALLKACKIC